MKDLINLIYYYRRNVQQTLWGVIRQVDLLILDQCKSSCPIRTDGTGEVA